MLKALELVGFKSFADKTRFEFPAGITAVVGPNGSGKSNVVDGIKWVLGEQSIKSLRGKEMADVIFNGSSSRQPMNYAEATLTFDNASHSLPLETPEVHISRRVYRNGESEYLINRQPSRLRDIRDLFAGTGAGTEAYCIIEQGKVDVLLQSSARDRRAIFEEAAGISRFKAKKVESLRRLERVEQNLLRLADIVSEVENQLKSIRAQATKAQRYREYTGRLQELRTQVALADWRQLTNRLTSMETELAELRQEAAEASAEGETLEVRALESETRMTELTEEIRTCEARIAENRERIAAQETTIDHERTLVANLEADESRFRNQLAAMNLKIGDLVQQAEALHRDVATATESRDEIRAQAEAEEQSLAQLATELSALRAAVAQERQSYLQALRTAANLGSEISALDSQRQAAAEAQERLARRGDELTAARTEAQQHHEQLLAASAQLLADVEQATTELASTQARLAEARTRATACTKELHQARQAASAAQARAAVLDELEQRLEGLSAGVKDVLLAARSDDPGPWRQVVGLVADVLRVKVEMAGVIDVALGDRAAHLIVGPGDALWNELAAGTLRVPGRVGFLRDRASEDDRFVANSAGPDLSDRAGIVGPAELFVETSPEWAPLARRLLGRTWIVETLPQAFTLWAEAPEGTQFVTLGGELLAADGTLVVGSWLASPGLISRKSELRVLRDQLVALEQQAAAAEQTLAELERQIATDELHALRHGEAHAAAAGRLAEHRLQVANAQQRLAQAADQLAATEQDAAVAQAQQQAAEQSLSVTQMLRREADAEVARLEQSLAQASKELDALDTERGRRSAELTGVKVRLAKAEDRLDNLQTQERHLQHNQDERRRAIAESNQLLVDAQSRARQSRSNILQASAAVAELFLRKESLAAETVSLVEERERLRIERGEQAQQAQRARARMRRVEERVHSKDLAANEVRLQRSTLAAQLREDYDVELAELEHVPSAEEERARVEVDQEIAELRRKINNLGNVNLDALDELDSLEARHQALAAQFKDLSDAKDALERIIQKINGDSRRLFAETLETVKGHFQTLFRKLVGGGHADIVLEDGVDILDSGIEILARPPGKEPRNISLLSGGEKTLTCVALLLAIFRSRPSPFCVLDEVDAALDEANIERFIGVLKEFLAWTQFIIITHSKKTMTCASTLYGVTMQESGISKRVSVHFDDISDDGEFRWSPMRESQHGDDSAAA